jgi:hypothetical protein
MQFFSKKNYDFEENYSDEFVFQELQNDFLDNIRTKNRLEPKNLNFNFKYILISFGLIITIIISYWFISNENSFNQISNLKNKFTQKITNDILAKDFGRRSETEPELVKQQSKSSPKIFTSEPSSKSIINVDSLAESDFNTNQVLEIKEITKDKATILSLKDPKANQKIKITIDYVNNNKDVKDASLVIKVSEGLKVLPASLKDSFMEKEEQSVDDKVYDANKNLIVYGPNTKDKSKARINNLEKGKFSFVVEIQKPEIKHWAVASFIKDNIERETLNHGFVFIES